MAVADLESPDARRDGPLDGNTVWDGESGGFVMVMGRGRGMGMAIGMVMAGCLTAAASAAA